MGIKTKTDMRVLEEILGDRYIKQRENGRQVIKKLVSYHHCNDGSEVKFQLTQESDGTQRLIDLLPAFVTRKSDRRTHRSSVFAIDELDRSLHYLLLRRLLEDYLSSCHKQSRPSVLYDTRFVANGPTSAAKRRNVRCRKGQFRSVISSPVG